MLSRLRPLLLSGPRPRAPRPRRQRSVRPAFEALEDRTVPSTLQGALFQDLNANAARDAGEPGLALAGVTVYLDQDADGLRDAAEPFTATAADGLYEFTGLAAGAYRVVQEQPGGWMQTSPAGAATDHQLGDVLRSFPAPGADPLAVTWAGGFLYVNDYQIDVINKVDPATGAVLASFSTPGPYQINSLAFDGTYFWATDSLNDVVLPLDGAGAVTQSFASPGPSPRGVAWDGDSVWVADTSTDRLYDLNPATGAVLQSFAGPSTEVRGLAFDGAHLWVGSGTEAVELSPATGQPLQSFVTPQQPGSSSTALDLTFDGQHFWLVMPSETLYEVEAAPFGNRGAALVTLADGQTVSGIDFGDLAVNTIAGQAFNDLDGDGGRDAGEPAQQGWRVYLDANQNGRYDGGEPFTRTDAAGDYRLVVRQAGTYTARVELVDPVWGLPHWTTTAPASGSYVVTFAAPSGDSATGRDFATYLNRVDPSPGDWARLDGGTKDLYTGLVWVNESTADAADRGITGGAVQYTWAFAQTRAADSTRNGYDDWRMPAKAEALAAADDGAGQAGFLYGTGNGYLYWTSTVSGNRAWAVDLNNPADPGVLLTKTSSTLLAMVRDSATVIDDGSAGYADTGWTLKTGSPAYQGDYRTRAAGNGSGTATWTFTGLEVGASYKVAVIWKAASGNASNAPYTVLDGTAAEATVAVNQRVSPDDFSIADLSWEGIGTYTIDSGTLAVRLSNLANGTVVADAVRVFRVYPATPPAGGAPLAGGGAGAAIPGTQAFTAVEAQPLLQEAVFRQEAAGLSAEPVAAQGGSHPGLASGSAIGTDAAGYGWFIAPGPGDGGEPGTPGGQGRMGLLTAVLPERGEGLGLGDADEGVRRLPEAADALTAGLDRAFAALPEFWGDSGGLLESLAGQRGA